MDPKATCKRNDTLVSGRLYLAFELSGSEWILGFTIGMNSARVCVMDFFAWRAFHNRREPGLLAGPAPAPYARGGSSRERRISQAGTGDRDRLVRAAIPAGQPIKPLVSSTFTNFCLDIAPFVRGSRQQSGLHKDDPGELPLIFPPQCTL